MTIQAKLKWTDGMQFVGILAWSAIIGFFAGTLGGRNDFNAAYVLVALALTPYVAGTAMLSIPVFGLLFWQLGLHKPHARPLYRLADGFCIIAVVLVGLQVRLDKGRRHHSNEHFPVGGVIIDHQNTCHHISPSSGESSLCSIGRRIVALAPVDRSSTVTTESCVGL